MWHQRKLTKKEETTEHQNNARNKKCWRLWFLCVLFGNHLNEDLCSRWQAKKKGKKGLIFQEGLIVFVRFFFSLSLLHLLFIVGRTSCDACEPHVGPCWTSRASPKPKKSGKNRLSIDGIQLKINIGTWKRRMRRTSSWKARSTFILNLAEHSR